MTWFIFLGVKPLNFNALTSYSLRTKYNREFTMSQKSTDNLIRLVKSGGNLTIDVSEKSTDNVIRLAKTAVALRNKITFVGMDNKSTDNVIRVIKAGGDYVHIQL